MNMHKNVESLRQSLIIYKGNVQNQFIYNESTSTSEFCSCLLEIDTGVDL